MMRPIALLSCVLAMLAATPAVAVPVPKPPSVSAQSYLLMDTDTGRVLASEEADRRMAPASLTKIMTAYVVYKALAAGSISLADEVEISENAWRMGGSQMFLEVGTTATVDELLDGLVVQSGNDAALALAEHVAGSESAFVEQMNHYVEALGLENTHFVNSEGLQHEEHYSTARDVAKMTRALIREFPGNYERYSKKEFTYNNIRQYNRNELLWSDPSVDGVKTGYTAEAGYCLVASSRRDGMRLISVVMGAPSEDQRAADSRSLIAWGFRFYDTHRLFATGEVLREARIWKGARDIVPLGLDRDLVVTIPRGEYENLDATMSFPGRLVAPARRGDTLGTVTVTLNGEQVAEAPLVALEAVARGNFLQRAADTVIQWFQ